MWLRMITFSKVTCPFQRSATSIFNLWWEDGPWWKTSIVVDFFACRWILAWHGLAQLGSACARLLDLHASSAFIIFVTILNLLNLLHIQITSCFSLSSRPILQALLLVDSSGNALGYHGLVQLVWHTICLGFSLAIHRLLRPFEPLGTILPREWAIQSLKHSVSCPFSCMTLRRSFASMWILFLRRTLLDRSRWSLRLFLVVRYCILIDLSITCTPTTAFAVVVEVILLIKSAKLFIMRIIRGAHAPILVSISHWRFSSLIFSFFHL